MSDTPDQPSLPAGSIPDEEPVQPVEPTLPEAAPVEPDAPAGDPELAALAAAAARTSADPVVERVEPAPAAPSRRPRLALRFGVAFLVGVLVAMLLGTSALYAYDQQYQGRVLPGVKASGVDLSGMDRDEVVAALEQAYATARDGTIVVSAGSVAEIRIDYEDIDRHVDVDLLANEAMAAGRFGNPVERAVLQARTALSGIQLEPTIVLDEAALAARLDRSLEPLELAPVDGSIAMGAEGIDVTPARVGRTFDRAAIQAAVVGQLVPADAPAEIRVAAIPRTVAPRIDDTDTQIARTTAERMIADLTLKAGDESWALTADEVRGWIDFKQTVDGRIAPVADITRVTADLGPIAKDVARAPKNASYLIDKGGAIVGVTASQDGRSLDAESTAASIMAALQARAAGTPEPGLAPTLVAVKPALTTAEAEKVAPRMTRISTWQTYFPISEGNYYGANIWIPASIIDGTVLAPGETFDFWRTVGEVSRARGYGSGGAIINGKTEITGALAGGICSCSTTLFNAALRAGLKMGERGPHYYYIERYPLGLDATVWKSGGSQQSMSFTNDTPYPILIRGINTRKGSAGYVRFDLYSVPTGRTVSFSKPVVKDIVRATTRTVYTSSLRPGQRKQTEFAHDGKKVWVTRTVRDANGKVIHQETFYSHYKPVNGIIMVGSSSGTASTGGSGGSVTPTPEPTGTPTPTPEPTGTPTP